MAGRPIITIDISEVNNPVRKSHIIADLAAAATDVGFFYLVGTGISVQDINDDED